MELCGAGSRSVERRDRENQINVRLLIAGEFEVFLVEESVRSIPTW